MTHIDAMKQGLEALEVEDMACRYEKEATPEYIAKAITSLRQAIAEVEKENALQSLHAENERLGLYKDAYAEQEPVAIDGNTSDGYHTFNELYEFRKAYNAALFNEWSAGGKCSVHKSWRHHDGELCFGGGWFIVVAVLPNGQISNHYEAKDWDLFNIPETECALFEFDGHTSTDVVTRLNAYAHPPQHTEQEPVIDKSAAIRIATALGWEPKRTWVGLTDEDWVEIFGNSRTIGAAVRNTEAKLKEKNT